MKIKFRLLSFLLAFALVAGNCSQIVAYADENTVSMRTAANAPQKNESVKELTDLEITDLEEPGEGKPLDTKATVRSAEGVTWEIPVVWIGEDGKAATVAEPGKKYIPNFAFYIPKGYGARGSSAFGRLSIRLPLFLQKYGLNNLIYAFDPLSGITYISWDMTNILEPAYQISVYEPKDSDCDSSDRDNSDSNRSDSGNEDDEYDEDRDPYWEVNVHCTRNLIANVGYESLARLVRLLKNEIEPRAIAALIEGVPAFSDAADNGELGEFIGLYVYDARFDSGDEDPRNITNGADAYVYGAYDEDDYYYMMAVNTGSLLIKNESGIYELSETALSEAKNIIIHELMHALMDDYTRTGNSSIDNYVFSPEEPGAEPYKKWNAFPKWFIEGSASTVHHVYQYQEGAFHDLSVLFDQDCVREEDDPLYTDMSVIRAFQDPDPRTSTNIRVYRTSSNEDIGGAYTGGYLAVVYLSLLVANDGKDPAIPDNDQVRMGFNSILTSLHNGVSLDNIIKGTGKYNGIIDFENRFVSDGDDSTRFVVDFLNHLDRCGTDGKRANGSILLPFDTDKDSPLDGRTETSNGQSVLLVADERDPILSTADDQTARNSAGSYHTWEDSDWGTSEDEEPAAAAITKHEEKADEPAAEETVTEEPETAEQVSEEPAAEESATEEPAAEDTGSDDTGSDDTGSEDDTSTDEEGSGNDPEGE